VSMANKIRIAAHSSPTLGRQSCNLAFVGTLSKQELTTYAAVDIGSNSVRLKIAAVNHHRLKTLHEDREVTRLGESVFESGVVSPESMASTIRALRRFHRAVQAHSVDRLRVVATSALRDARNQQAFLAWVHSATGWKVEIISGLEEGRLIHLGVVSNEPAARGRCIMIDLGGGSCEITLSENSAIRQMVSLPLGAVRLTREFLRHDPPIAEEVSRMEDWIRRELRRAEQQMAGERIASVFATSGTAAALAAAALANSRLGVKLSSKAAAKTTAKAATKIAKLLPHTKVKAWERTPTASVRKIASKLKHMTVEQRTAVPGIGPKRSEIIVAGAHVYADLLERLNLPGFRYSPMGLRDGILALMLAEGDANTFAHQQFEQERWEGVLQLCRRYGVDPRQQEPVVEHACQFFDDLKRVHQLPPEYRLWLKAAAMMHPVGKFMNYQGHHRHTQYIIANSELYGFTPEQRLIVSAIARYLGKSRPGPADRVMRAIPVENHAFIKRAAVLLRLATALHQDKSTAVLRVVIRISPQRVNFQLLPGRTRADLELWLLRKEAGYFREVFARDLLVALA
jgi:exopolyphosphatase/guanosine-5'-triphosphate,3'-diphosphate pyrophosphatase